MPKRKRKEQSVLSKRGWLFAAKVIVLVFLAIWSLSAFYEHLDSLKASRGAYVGAAGTEAIMLILAIFSSFFWKIRTRKEALIFNVILGVFVLFHAGGLRGLMAAELGQRQSEARLAENLNRLTAGQADTALKTQTKQSAKIGKADAAKNARATIQSANKAAVDSLSEFTKTSHERIADSTIFPRWYVNGGMFSVMFMLGLLFFGRVSYTAITDTDVDRDFDGEVDESEAEFPQSLEREAGK